MMYWLIVERDSFRMSVYTVPGEEALPVFSHEGEAESFLRARGLGDCWRARETGVGELVSLLLGPCADVSSITLDPTVGTGACLLSSGLVIEERRTFVDFLMRGSRAGEVGAPLTRGRAIQ